MHGLGQHSNMVTVLLVGQGARVANLILLGIAFGETKSLVKDMLMKRSIGNQRDPAREQF
jgi:hypothetical protein